MLLEAIGRENGAAKESMSVSVSVVAAAAAELEASDASTSEPPSEHPNQISISRENSVHQVQANGRQRRNSTTATKMATKKANGTSNSSQKNAADSQDSAPSQQQQAEATSVAASQQENSASSNKPAAKGAAPQTTQAARKQRQRASQAEKRAKLEQAAVKVEQQVAQEVDKSVSAKHQQQQQQQATSNQNQAAGQQANICAACLRPIKERYLLVALEKQWHEDCLKCACCDCRLGEVGSSLFTHSDKILCRRDFLRIFGQHGHCAACKKTIPPYEMVMRANDNAYHMDCFACHQCHYRFCVGDRFHLTEAHNVICVDCFTENQQQAPDQLARVEGSSLSLASEPNLSSLTATASATAATTTTTTTKTTLETANTNVTAAAAATHEQSDELKQTTK